MTALDTARRLMHQLPSASGLRASVTLLTVLLGCAAARAQGVSLSQSLSAPIGQSFYSESEQTGPSGSLIPGDNNFTSPYIRSGVSDPLGFLLESTVMSPYTPEQSFALSYPDTYVHDDLVNDATVAARFSEYRSNRLLMSGAGASALRTGRAEAAGRGLSAQTGTGAGGAAASAFSRVGMLAPFAAGSSALAAGQAGLSNPGFVDPNALVAALTSSAVLGGVPGSTADASSFGSDTGMVGLGSGSGVSDPDADTMSMSLGAVPLGALVPPASSLPYGPQPGGVFPNVSASMQSGTGFQDSTLGTAGLPGEYTEARSSPLLSSYADSTSGPFHEMSSENAHFLAPTLLVGADSGDVGQGTTVSLSELKRQARLHAMIYTPGSPLPSPFEERAMEKDYLKKQHHQSHYPRLLAPSVTP